MEGELSRKNELSQQRQTREPKDCPEALGSGPDGRAGETVQRWRAAGKRGTVGKIGGEVSSLSPTGRPPKHPMRHPQGVNPPSHA